MRQEEQQVTQGHPEAVRSAPVPVHPPARHGDGHRSDRAARSDVPEDALDDRGTFDDPTAPGERTADGPDRRETDETRAYDARERRDAEAADTGADGRPEYHDPAPLPTAFGATTVADAVAASAMASGRPEDERDARGEDTAQPGDGAPGRTDQFDYERADPNAGDRLHDPDRWAAERSGATRDDALASAAAGYGSAEPAMVDPDASTAAAGAGVAGAAGAGTAGGVPGAAAGTAGGIRRDAEPSVPPDAATLFAPEVAQNFRHRWRDVQLRFVDDPRAAVGEAQSLVEEAIEALSAALREQKTKLGGGPESGSADTEQLRVAVRSYRDFLYRVLGR
ncbi:hypothetical protein GA0074695_1449 [Micromonospora viridifaciens]|uniref:Uncharacterized protein n=1 Tax=Micromonospora viridifaciens TaxID=1881 RepID=A0A1C4VH19_MICVI|nr:hypothetical protein [Micromonospora viridifaciens]SCE83065.1 hypothetical protein GA0074695_1449 [Micromonospora viridifaciens]